MPCDGGFGQWLLCEALPSALEAIEGGGAVEGRIGAADERIRGTYGAERLQKELQAKVFRRG